MSDDDGEFTKILRNLEGSMSGGRISEQAELSRQSSFTAAGQDVRKDSQLPSKRPNGLERQDSLGLSALAVEDEEVSQPQDPRKWLKVVSAFEQPRLRYNTTQKHFEAIQTAPSLLPSTTHKTNLFRHRYNTIHQMLLRNESFQTSTIAASRSATIRRSASTLTSTQQAYKLTPIENLLGRNGSSHILLGLLAISPTGLLTLNDLTGSIALDITHARPAPEDGAWFTPGMLVLIDGMYEEGGNNIQGLDRNVGIGGSIGGKITVFSMGGPPCERRDVTMGVSSSGINGTHNAGGGFGWVDFLGVGSERATGSMMRRLEHNIFKGENSQTAHGRSRMVFLGDLNLDNTQTLQALRKVFGLYEAEVADEVPIVFALFGNFSRKAVMAGSRKNGSLEYKECFDALASVMSDYPSILQNATFVFVPGDNDPWASAFSAGAATVVPRDPIPTMFTNRIRKAFSNANSEAERITGKKANGEAIWSTNPTRLSLLGPTHEIVLFRDDISGRLRRNALRFPALRQTGIEENTSRGSEAPEAQSLEMNGEGTTQGTMDVDTAVEEAESTLPTIKERPQLNSAPLLEVQSARKLVKTVLDQAFLSPSPISQRPVLWDYANALQLYPLPTALVLMDSEAAPFSVSYQGCLVMNPGCLAASHEKNVARWVEYDIRTRQGIVKDARI